MLFRSAGAGFVAGTITSVDGSTLTITTQQGTKETVTVPSSATVTTTQSSSVSALKAGERVTAVGTPGSSSGSLTASRVSEGQTFGTRGGRPGNTGGTGGTGSTGQ